MNTALDLKVYDPKKHLSRLVGACEAEFEENAERILGHPVDFQITHQSLNAICQGSHLPTSELGAFCIADFMNPHGVVQRFEQLLQALVQRLVDAALIVTTHEVFNNPKVQALVFKHQDPSRFGMLIEPDTEVDKAQLTNRFHALLATALPGMPEGQKEAIKQFHPPYLKATRGIRNERSGRLDVKRVAAFFGLSSSELAKIVGVTRQAVSKTPDSKGIQEKLRPFEEIARGMLLVEQDKGLFLQWLNTPSDELPMNKHEGRRYAPIDVIKLGHPEVVAGMVEASLTGHPS